MKIPKNCKIELCTSSDRTRPSISEPYLDGDKLIATDGRRLVVLPVEREEGDTDGRVTAAALAAGRRQAKKREPVAIAVNGCFALKDGTTLPRKGDDDLGKFPNWKQIVPSGDDYPHFIVLNAGLLWEMAQAMGAQNVRIAIKDATSPALITSLAAPGAVGVLMPVRST